MTNPEIQTASASRQNVHVSACLQSRNIIVQQYEKKLIPNDVYSWLGSSGFRAVAVIFLLIRMGKIKQTNLFYLRL